MPIIRDLFLLIRSIFITLKNIPYRRLHKEAPIWLKEQYQRLLKEWGIIRIKMKDLAGTNYQLACSHFYRGNISDAIMRFKMVLRSKKYDAQCHLYLSRCYLIKDKRETAQSHLQALQAIAPPAKLPLTDYIQCKLQNDSYTPKNTLSDVLLEEKANRLLFFYDTERATNRLETIAQAAIHNLYTFLFEKKETTTTTILDVSGMAGSYTKAIYHLCDLNKHILKTTVMDTSERVIEHLKNQTIEDHIVFDRLIKALPIKQIDKEKRTYDLILTGELLNYVHTPEAVIASLAKRLKPSATLMLHISITEEKKTRFDQSYDRFLHPITTIDRACKANTLVKTAQENSTGFYGEKKIVLLYKKADDK